MRDILEGAKMNTLVVSELAIAHITMVFDNFTDVFRRQVLRGQKVENQNSKK
jgi:hypothetical protein